MSGNGSLPLSLIKPIHPLRVVLSENSLRISALLPIFLRRGLRITQVSAQRGTEKQSARCRFGKLERRTRRQGAMKRNGMKRWVGACLLGSAVATGCSQTGSQVDERPTWVSTPYVPPKTDRPVVSQRTVATPTTQLPMNLPAPDALPAAAGEQKDTVKDASVLQTALDSSRLSPVAEPSSVRRA